jgi:hypothetical protein
MNEVYKDRQPNREHLLCTSTSLQVSKGQYRWKVEYGERFSVNECYSMCGSCNSDNDGGGGNNTGIQFYIIIDDCLGRPVRLRLTSYCSKSSNMICYKS